MLVNHIAVIVRQRDLLQLKRRVGGKQLLLKALQTFAVRTVIHTGRNDRSHRAALPRHQTHQLGHRTAGRNVFLPDIAQPTAVGQIGVKRNDRYSALVDQLVDFGFDQQTVERHDRQRTDMMLLDQILDHRDLFDRIERGRQPEDDLHAERSQTAGFAPGGIQNDLHERSLHRNNDHADANRMRCAGQCQTGTVGGVAIFGGYRLDPLRHRRANISFIMECPIDCTAGHTANLGNLIQGNCHMISPLSERDFPVFIVKA